MWGRLLHNRQAHIITAVYVQQFPLKIEEQKSLVSRAKKKEDVFLYLTDFFN